MASSRTKRSPRGTSREISIATVNVNGLRAASANGMAAWFTSRRPDILTLQEVRAPDAMVPDLVTALGAPEWRTVHDECRKKGRAGVAVASGLPFTDWRSAISAGPSPLFDDSGRWVEADLDTSDGRGLTVISCYVHKGDETSTERMHEKLAFLDAMLERLESLRTGGRHVLLTGDLNVAHREVDLKNWKGNLKKAGFLPEERAWFDRMTERSWVDVGRLLAGDRQGPYTWWSWRGQAFDNDAGWRIDYHLATPDLAATASAGVVDRAASYAERWSDHAPVVITYRI